MDLASLTRQLVDIESVTGNERRVGEFLLDYLSALGYHARAMPVEDGRFNVLAVPPEQARHCSSSPRTWIPCRLSSRPPKTKPGSTAADRATPRASSPRRLRPPNSCAARDLLPACCSW